MRSCLGWLLPAMVVLLLTVPLRAQEWPRFRGPNGSGVSAAKTVPVAFTEKDYNWRVELPGSGHSSPVIWGDRIFVTSADEASGKRYLVCVRTSDGKKLWTQAYDFTAYAHNESNSAASSTPAVDAGSVYVPWETPASTTILALTHEGKELWKRDLGPYPAQHGGALSPVVVGDLVILNKVPDGGGSVYALDRKTGAIRWKYDHASTIAAYSTPLVYRPADGPPQLIATDTAGMTSLDPATGKLNWEVKNVFRARCVASPVLGGPEGAPLVFATAGDGGGDRQAVAVRPGTKEVAASIAYQPTKGISYVPTPIAVGGRLYLWGDGGIVSCLRAADGEPVWMERVDGRFFGSPVCVNGNLYAIDNLGEVVVIAAGDTFKLLARNPLGEASHSTPAVSGGIMYLRTVSHLISVGRKKR
jgi:outer membrane protein assembly factor BamB